jgi:hypothetical protein
VWADKRGVTVQIGAVLLLGVLMLLLTMYQTAVVPSENHDVEFTHNERVQSDLLDARNGIIRAATSGSTQPGSVELGTTFPSRVIAINPAPAGGTLGPSSVSGNATLTGAEPLDRNARAYWSNTSHNMSYRTQGFRYEPSYREYTTAPDTVYENTVLYNEFPGGPNRTVSGQLIIDGRTISLISLQDVPRRSTSNSVGLTFRAVSPSSTQVRTLAVTNTSGESLNITLPTQLSNDTWSELLANEPYVDRANMSVEDGEVTIPLVETRDGSTVTYNLRTAAVTAARTAERPEPAYITVVDGANRSVPENTTNTLVAEVRDRYNNPVSGAEVNATFESSVESLSGTKFLQLRSTGQGFAPVSYTASGDGSVDVSLAGSAQRATVSLFGFETGSEPVEVPNNVTRNSGSSGRVHLSYAASGSGSFTASLSSVRTLVSRATLGVYSVAGSIVPDGPVFCVDCDGETTPTDHYEVNNDETYSDKTLIIPSGSTFGPEDGETGPDKDIDYTFRDYQIDGELSTENQLSLEATDGQINIGSGGSVVSGKQLTFTATGPNGSINADGATLDATSGSSGPGNGRIKMTTSGDISAVGSTMTANKKIVLTADGSIDLTDSSLVIEDGGTITLDAGDDLILNRTTLEIVGNGDATAEATRIYVSDSEFEGGANPLQINSGTVYGSPAVGDTDPPQNT